MYMFLVMLLAGFPLYLLLKQPIHPLAVELTAESHTSDHVQELACVSEASSNVS